MSKQANPATIGAFIVGAVIVLVAGILVFSGDTWFSKKDHFIVYFLESINGLSIGSPIKLSGVQIGQVTRIRLERDQKLNKILVPVEFEVNPEAITDYVEFTGRKFADIEMDALIKDGLRMQLQLASLVTGKLYIEAKFDPGAPANFFHNRSDLIEIPSTPSRNKEVQNALRKALGEFQNINFQELFETILKTASNLERITGSEETQMTLAALNASMLDFKLIMNTLQSETGMISRELRQTIKRADQLLLTLDSNTGPLLQDSRATISNANATLLEMKSTLANVQMMTNQEAPISQDLQTTLKELAGAARSMRVLMDYLERHPDALIYGKAKQPGSK